MMFLLASGYWFLATGFWVLASGFWLLASGFGEVFNIMLIYGIDTVCMLYPYGWDAFGSDWGFWSWAPISVD